MAPSELMEARVRRAYEWGRVRAGLTGAWPVGLLVGLSLFARDRLATSLVLGGALLALAVGFTWWGGALARAVKPALYAAFAPVVLPLVAVTAATGHACARCALGGTSLTLCFAACVTGGVVAGVVVGLRAAGIPRGRLTFVIGAGLLVALGGSLGCGLVGASGVIGLVAGLALGSVPTLALARR